MRILTIAIRELRRIIRLPAHYVVLLILPVVIYFFYGFIYQNQFARELPVALWDEDGSGISRQLSDMLEATPSIHFVTHVSSEAALRKAILEGKVLGAIHFPRHMESDIKAGRQVNVSVFSNAAAIVGAKMIYKDAAAVIIKGSLAVIIEKNTKQGMSAGEAMALVQPVKLNTYTLFNPAYNYKQFLTPGLITVAIQMALIMIAVLILNYEFQTKSFEELIIKSNYSASTVIVGKTIAHLLVSWYIFILVFFIVFPVFGLDRSTHLSTLFLLYNALALACIGIGIMVSAIVKDVMTATDIALFFTSPAFVFSGFTYPRWAMPWYDQYYAAIMPYTYFLDAFIKCYFMGLDTYYILPELFKLLLFIVVCYTVALIVLQRRINNHYLKKKGDQ